MKKSKYSAIVVGCGIAGLFATLELSKYKNLNDGILLISKGELGESNSRHAQGGIVAVLEQNEKDSVESHIKDTLNAGGGLSDFYTAKNIAENSEEAINKLLEYGVSFDRNEDNNLRFTLEAAHSVPRILHSGGDATGYGIEKGLLNAIKKANNITIYEHSMAVELLKDKKNSIRGLISYNTITNSHEAIFSPCVILATGGIGQIYKYTTNPTVATADGQAIAYEAKADLQDMEFVQFHPTSLAIDSYENRFLISEALRGEGAKLVDLDGNRFMSKYDDRMELATRDVVTKSIYNEMNTLKYTNMYLDITHKSKEFLQNRFPTIYNLCLENHIDISKDLIPVSPAAHYSMGGIKTDIHGRTTLNGLFAVGEVASTGLHGANRLASNSLIECVVIANNLIKNLKYFDFTCHDSIDENVLQTIKEYSVSDINEIENIYELRQKLQDTMWQNVGIVKSEKTLLTAQKEIEEIEKILGKHRVCSSREEYELRNLVTISKVIISSALQRTESRGAHYREDYPQTDEIAHHSCITKGVGENVEVFAT